jgi:arsenate reductase
MMTSCIASASILLGCTIAVAAPAHALEMNPRLARYIAQRSAEFDEIPAERRALLAEVADYVRSEREAGRAAKLVFICTANSRRSHVGHLWAAAAGAHNSVSLETFSGGMERTAFNPRAIAALERAGFDVGQPIVDGDNPHYQVRFAKDAPAIEAFSKTYTEAPNPSREFCAIMTCTQADEACPNVAGAVKRIALPYDDPKASDGTAEEAATYDERCAQIAREMLYALSLVNAHDQ